LKITHTSEHHSVIERFRNIFAKIVLSVIQLLTKKKSAMFEYRHPLGCLQKKMAPFSEMGPRSAAYKKKWRQIFKMNFRQQFRG